MATLLCYDMEDMQRTSPSGFKTACLSTDAVLQRILGELIVSTIKTIGRIQLV